MKKIQYMIVKCTKPLFYGLKKPINLTIKLEVTFSPFPFFLSSLLGRSNLCSMQSVKQTQLVLTQQLTRKAIMGHRGFDCILSQTMKRAVGREGSNAWSSSSLSPVMIWRHHEGRIIMGACSGLKTPRTTKYWKFERGNKARIFIVPHIWEPGTV